MIRPRAGDGGWGFRERAALVARPFRSVALRSDLFVVVKKDDLRQNNKAEVSARWWVEASAKFGGISIYFVDLIP